MPHPGNEVLFDAIRDAVGTLVHTRPGQGLADSISRRLFTENGGSLYYEFVPQAPQGGLIEAGTPECRSPAQLLLYQRAQDQLLTEATRRAQEDLRRRGIVGQLALLKNCRDAEGHVYGAQENYEAELTRGLGLVVWWLAILAALPFALVSGLVHLLLMMMMLAVALPAGAIVLVWMIAAVLLGRSEPDDVERHAERWTRLFDLLGSLELVVAHVMLLPSTAIVAAAVRLVAFRPYRRGALAFWVSRCIVSGAGTLEPDGRLVLSEKALAIRRLSRWSVLPGDRGLLEVGHLIKPLHALAWLDWRGVVALLKPRQRLQLGLSDANLCDVAEVLKVGTTALVLDLVEAGELDDAPMPADPVAALHALARDPTLTARVPLRGGGEASALELQRFYQRRAADWLERSERVSLDAHELVARWGEVLDRLEDDPGSLFGRIDWITKRRLLDDAADLEPDARKKIDLRYHELGSGYFAWLETRGLCPRLVDDAEIDHATREPPSDTPAHQRGRLVRALSESGTDARVGWSHVRVKGPGARIIRLEDVRKGRDPR